MQVKWYLQQVQQTTHNYLQSSSLSGVSNGTSNWNEDCDVCSNAMKYAMEVATEWNVIKSAAILK